MARLAYFFSAFPKLSETFVLSQVQATRTLGLPCLTVANRRPAVGSYDPKDQDLVRSTFYLNPVQPQAYGQALVWAWRTRPQALRSALRLALTLQDAGHHQRLRLLAHLAGAAVLARFCQAQQVAQVHVHYAYGAASVALFLKTLAGIPYSLSIHGSDVLLANPFLEAKLAGARFIVSNCQYHCQQLRARFPSLAAQRFYIVPGGVDLSQGLWAEPVPPVPDGPLRLLLVGRLVPVKGIDLLLAACARLQRQQLPFVCQIVGDGPERPRLAARIQALGLEKVVTLLGARYQAEVARLYDWCQVVVLSSRSEGTPMTIIEAMAKARPVVAPRLTAIPEMVVEGETGLLFEPGAAADLAAQLARLAADPELRLRMGVAARQQAAAKFDLWTNAQQFLAILAQEVPALHLHPPTEVPHDISHTLSSLGYYALPG
ncbi:MAG: glycosyltransferase [Desulfobacca sp.]|uniref:glycosyltransferase n=1 Tax=Desulfobacca sp. TaxID=2067990 RepID=UPI00404937F7